MKKLLALLLCAFFIFSGCTAKNRETSAENLLTEAPTETPKEEKLPLFPFEEEKDFIFSSGAGGWGTFLTLRPDGTFVGEYSDSEMGEMEEEYPGGSVYICSFTGAFTNVEKVDEFTYSMKLDHLSYEEKEEWIEDGIRFVPSKPFGIEGGETFYLYLPGKEVKDIPEDFLWWWFEYLHAPDNQKPENLDCYAIYNVEQQCGFTE